mmetsp:Transcript_22020/g.28329  ORF Transcript_22020/g.28329 Transcript_22020/m.28329 type:complete len:96 (+) Transcript_22020:261-548(+)|eukprot:CAMPEP_0116064360 /NCGR_PEP_ID=MMETSP0322-20121206/9047_1 /TAXON_ID=163516 /ORGANISM="Leptocylindrus danicus var. apora, Strain B651" /LENGTH=95 /DNA_ID=CAMNT_0003550321 /DNA_START=881 /DNA_END=1168 /DNA_ORIENTATION=-
MGQPRKLRQRNEKYAKNVNKRGNVSVGKAAQHDKEIEPPKHLVIIFFILVVGSIFVQVYRMTQAGTKSLQDFTEAAEAAQQQAPDSNFMYQTNES